MRVIFTTKFAASAVCLLAGMGGSAFAQNAAAACDRPAEVSGFKTCADVDAAKKEGAVVLYAPAGQAQQLAVLNEFKKLFPEIRVQSVWAQTGSLFAKVEQEVNTKKYVGRPARPV